MAYWPHSRCWRKSSGPGKPVSEVCKMFEPVPQVLKNVKFKSGKPLDDAQVKTAIAEATSRLGNAGTSGHSPPR